MASHRYTPTAACMCDARPTASTSSPSTSTTCSSPVVAISELLAIKRKLTQQYEMEDMGEATFILGIDIKRDRANRSISIGQSAYINRLLALDTAWQSVTRRPLRWTAGVSTRANSSSGRLRGVHCTLTRDYQSIIGGLMFAAICTRPDIAFAVNRLSRYCCQPHRGAPTPLLSVYCATSKAPSIYSYHVHRH